MEAATGLLKSHSDTYGDDVISALADIAEAEPKLFRKSFDLLVAKI